jgi:hypothetical protein
LGAETARLENSTRFLRPFKDISTLAAHPEVAMSEPITIPPTQDIEARIRSCREELAALKRLYRAAQAAEQAEAARQRRERSGQSAAGVANV